jgi:hypothetical protein
MKQFVVFIAAILVTACTTVDYRSSRFEEETTHQSKVAVLPVEVALTGRVPVGLTKEEIAEIEEDESSAFQIALYRAVLDRSSARQKDPIRVAFQPLSQTNRILADAGIGIRESWNMPADTLAELLEVDAVIRTIIHKERYLSDLESFGLEQSVGVFNAATEGRFGWMVPIGITTTHSVSADGELVAAGDGEVLWKVVVESSTDWRFSANEVVMSITRKLAKKFSSRA